MVKIQIDIDDEVNTKLRIWGLENGCNSKQEAINKILKDTFD